MRAETGLRHLCLDNKIIFWHLCVRLQTLQSFKSVIIIVWGRCNLKRPRRTVMFLPVLQNILSSVFSDFLQQTITMNENVQWQMSKDSVLFALSSGFFVSLFLFLFEKNKNRLEVYCSVFLFFSRFMGSLYLLLAYCLYWR